MFDGLAQLFQCMFVLLIVFVPLGIWKLIDIVIWLCQHVSFHASFN